MPRVFRISGCRVMIPLIKRFRASEDEMVSPVSEAMRAAPCDSLASGTACSRSSSARAIMAMVEVAAIEVILTSFRPSRYLAICATVRPVALPTTPRARSAISTFAANMVASLPLSKSLKAPKIPAASATRLLIFAVRRSTVAVWLSIALATDCEALTPASSYLLLWSISF